MAKRVAYRWGWVVALLLAITLVPGKATAVDSGYLLKELVQPNPVFQAYGIALDDNGKIYLAGTEITIADQDSGQVLERLDMNNIDVDRQGAGMDIQFDPIAVQEMIDMGITGFSPVIINLTPLPSVLPLLGLAPQREEDEILEISAK